MRFDRSSGWEDEGAEASGGEVSLGTERSPSGVPLPPGWVEDGGGRGESGELSVFPPLARKHLVFTWNAVLVLLSVSVYPGMLSDLTGLGPTHHEMRWLEAL